MPPKRSRDDGHHGAAPGVPGQGAPPRKQQRFEQVRRARTIDTHHAAPSAASGPSSSATLSGPSLLGLSTASASSLPPQLDVESQLASHRFEIQSLLRSMVASRSSSSTRAWQHLPRHLRRRAASHNLLALPKRLRAKGAAELRSSNTTPLSRSQQRKRRGESGNVGGYPRTKEQPRREELKKRASHADRKWLETHLWHAKRFRMSGVQTKVERRTHAVVAADEPTRPAAKTRHGAEAEPRWGFNLAETPNRKVERTSWRKAKHAATVHDASYHVHFRLEASARVAHPQTLPQGQSPLDAALARVLHLSGLADGWQEDASHWRDGQRECSTLLLSHAPPIPTGGRGDGSDGVLRCTSKCRVLAPLSILWLPTQHAPPAAGKSTGSGSKAPSKASVAPRATRAVLLRIHPAARRELHDALVAALRTYSNVQRGLGEDDEAPRLELRELQPAPAEITAGSHARGRRHGGALPVDGVASEASKRTKAGAEAATTRRGGSDVAGRTAGARRPRMVTWSAPTAAYNVFELRGPDAGRMLGGTLQPVDGGTLNTDDVLKGFAALTTSLSAGEVSPGKVLNLWVHDPRLSFPPRNAKRRKMGREGRDALVQWFNSRDFVGRPETRASRGVASGAGASVYSADVLPPRFSKGEIDSRRSQSRVPNLRLVPGERDDVVPVSIVQRCDAPRIRDPGLATSASVLAAPPASSCGYALVAPQGWGSAFWLSLVHPTPAVLGQVEVRRAGLEAGARGAYPWDWPGTDAHALVDEGAAEARRRKWERTPPAKRPSLAGGERGARGAFGGKEAWSCAAAVGSSDVAECTGVRLRARADPSDDEAPVEPWLCDTTRAFSNEVTLESVVEAWCDARRLDARGGSREGEGAETFPPGTKSSPRRSLLDLLVRALLRPSGLPSMQRRTLCDDGVAAARELEARGAVRVLGAAVVPVRLWACARGALEELSEVHLAADGDEEATWRRAVRGASDAHDAQAAQQLRTLEQSDRSSSSSWTRGAVGYVSAGGFSLERGKGVAVGGVTLAAWLELQARSHGAEGLAAAGAGQRGSSSDEGGQPDEMLVLVRGARGGVWRAAWMRLAQLES